MARYLASLVCLMLPFVPATSAANSAFVYPPPPGMAQNQINDTILFIGNEVTLQWYSNLTNYDVQLWQESPDEGASLAGTVYSSTTGAENVNFPWVVTIYDHNLVNSSVFFLWMGVGSQRILASRFLTMVELPADDNGASATSTTSSATAIATSGISLTSLSPNAATSAGVVAITATASSGSSPTATSTSSDIAKVGLGVGLGLGIPLILATAGLLAVMLLRHRREGASAGSEKGPGSVVTSPQHAGTGPGSAVSPPYYAQDGWQQTMASPKYMPSNMHEAPGLGSSVFEASTTRDPVEAPGNVHI